MKIQLLGMEPQNGSLFLSATERRGLRSGRRFPFVSHKFP
jgi:hypothetical protein